MVIADEHGVIESFSRTGEQLFGYAAEEVVGRNVSILMPSVVRDQHDASISRYLATGRRHVIGKGKTVIAELRTEVFSQSSLSSERWPVEIGGSSRASSGI